jgi:hypothetical protein
MLREVLQSDSSAASRKLKRFGRALKRNKPLLTRADQLIFLCGANQSENVASARRQAIKKFIDAKHQDTSRVVYAEGVFNELKKTGGKDNVLDLEHEISEIADKIVIVLESPSAFCELGAFAHPKLRSKLIVVNDSQFKQALSFINTGPLAAMIEAKAPILWYPMNADGVVWTDSIGAIFPELEKCLEVSGFSRAERLDVDLENLRTDKASLYLVHDLVLFTGPATYEELIHILIRMYGNKRYDNLKKLLGILKAAGLLSSSHIDGSWVYRTTSPRPYLIYQGAEEESLAAAFRGHHLKSHGARFQIA